MSKDEIIIALLEFGASFFLDYTAANEIEIRRLRDAANEHDGINVDLGRGIDK